MKESAPLLYGKTYTPVDITTDGDNTIARIRNRRAMGHDVGPDAMWCQEIAQCMREATARATRADKSKLEKYRKNYHMFLTSQDIMQDITKDGARLYAAEQVDKRGDTLYTDRKMMLLLMDKIVEFERTDKSRRNPTIAEATLAEDDGSTVEAVKANKKKGKGKGKGKVKGNVADTNVAATPRSFSKQCKFCDKAGHVESARYTKQNLEKFKHKMVGKVTVEKEPTVLGNGHW
jgi:hypothetical protein